MKASSGSFPSREIKLRVSIACSGIVLLCLALPTTAQPYKILHAFGTNPMGLYPRSALVQGPDGALYGTTEQGGTANRGQVFKVNPDGNGYTVLKNFTDRDGAYPQSGLALSATTLYGTTVAGGTNGNGTIFKLNVDGTAFAVLKEFGDGSGGQVPVSSLVIDGSTLYGTTAEGGINGTIFKLNTDGSGYVVLKYFTGDDGAYPLAGLTLSGSTLYGIAANGGSYGSGTIFKINTDGSGYHVLKNLGTDANSSTTRLVLSGSVLYGVATWGGNSGNGAVFRLNTDGSGFAVLKDFANTLEGRGPAGDLLLSGTTLYGTAETGGSSDAGTLFKVNTDGTGFAVLKDFTNSPDGAFCSAGLFLSGSTLYGTTRGGGNFGCGAVFKLETDGSAYSVITHFMGGDGAQPQSTLVWLGTNFYGTTEYGGAAGMGTLFRMNADGTGYTILKHFTNSNDGAFPQRDLVLGGNTLYGTTYYGGTNGSGTIFKINTDGSDFHSLYSFSLPTWNGSVTTNADGASPSGVILSGATLYGTAAEGGTGGAGAVFKINTDGSDFGLLHAFSAYTSNGSDWTNADGAYPSASPALSGSTLYGVTTFAGSNGGGTVFKVNTDGSGFSVLKSFSGPDGNGPQASLLLSDQTLYGTTSSGGGSGYGLVFKINTDGNDYAVLKDFTNWEEGQAPMSSLSLVGSTLYGTTAWGGILGYGAAFQLNTDGTGFMVIKQFTGQDGSSPAGVTPNSNLLYGVTTGGGNNEAGILFNLSLVPQEPAIELQPESQTAPGHSLIRFVAVASYLPTPAYQWCFNGNAIDGATNYFLELTDLQNSHAGGYSVVVTNSYGSVTSVVAVLTVEDPFFNDEPGSQYAHAGDTVSFHCAADGTQPLSFQWFKDDVRLDDGANVSGAQTDSLTLTGVLAADEGRYSVVVSNVNSTLASRTAVLVVQDPFIGMQPWSQSVNAGEFVQFDAAVYGTGLTCQWLKAGVPLDDGGNISGTHAAVLTVSNISSLDAGAYSLIVSNNYGVITSTVATLTVNPPQAYSVLHSFTGSEFNNDGTSPMLANLLVSGSTLYGTTPNGGRNGGGTVFKLNTDRTDYRVLHHFDVPPTSDGWWPQGGLLLSGATLYGTTEQGGSGVGTVFKLNTDGTGFSTLKSFNRDDGAYPLGSLTLAETTLYGTTQTGGSNDFGTIFRIDTNGNNFAVLHHFADYPTDGRWVHGGLLLSGTTLYGVTEGGGSSNAGVLFRINTDGTGYAVLRHFDPATGSWPEPPLVLTGTKLFGTASGGGPQNYGGVFQVNTDGTGYSVLHYFNVFRDGANPHGIVLVGSTLYGSTSSGGIASEFGTLFRINADGTDFRVLKRFTGGEGRWPFSGMVLSGNSLYGTTYSGGASDRGTVFRLSLLPVVSLQSQTTEAGSTIYLRAATGNDPTITYRWYFNGALIGSPTTNAILSLTNLQFYQAGGYTVLATNVFGAVTSGPAMLSVIPPVGRRPVPGLIPSGEPGTLLHIDYSDTLGPTAQWQPLDTVTLTSTSQFCFDISTPYRPQRFYRAWQTNVPSVLPTLDLRIVPALTLTGNIGTSVRVDSIYGVGPTDAWFTLATVTLTNTSQLYLDTAPLAPQRLYRLVLLP